jgi:hypothetical protein
LSEKIHKMINMLIYLRIQFSNSLIILVSQNRIKPTLNMFTNIYYYIFYIDTLWLVYSYTVHTCHWRKQQLIRFRWNPTTVVRIPFQNYKRIWQRHHKWPNIILLLLLVSYLGIEIFDTPAIDIYTVRSQVFTYLIKN